MTNRITYIARNIERALGREPVGDYFIITNKTPYSTEVKEKYPENVLLIESEEILDTYKLLLLPEVEKVIKDTDSSVLVFKNTKHIEDLCVEKNFKLLNPSAELSEKIENKISQVEWLGDLVDLLPEHNVSTVNKIEWKDKTLVVQWAHSHTGDGTLLIQKEEELDKLKEKFPYRETRVTDFIKGPAFTINAVITSKEILLGNISYQITGMLPFTENIFSTIGNDWSVTHTILTESHVEKIEEISKSIGEKMQKDGWKGLFGIDFMYDEERDKIYLTEINPRQPASTTYESFLQRTTDENGLSIFNAHIESLLDETVESELIEINDGAQIIQRVTSKEVTVDIVKLEESGYKVIKYSNRKQNDDLYRIQSPRGIMETHNKFNKRGEEVLGSIK